MIPSAVSSRRSPGSPRSATLTVTASPVSCVAQVLTVTVDQGPHCRPGGVSDNEAVSGVRRGGLVAGEGEAGSPAPGSVAKVDCGLVESGVRRIHNLCDDVQRKVTDVQAGKDLPQHRWPCPRLVLRGVHYGVGMRSGVLVILIITSSVV